MKSMSLKPKTQSKGIKLLALNGYQKKTEQYKFSWVNEDAVPAQWLCMICKEPLQDPWMHSQCDKFFCFQCVKQAHYKCPQCRRGHSSEWSGKVGYSVNASLAQLKVQCSKCNSCTEYGEMENHLQFHCAFGCELNCGVQVHGSIGQKNHLVECVSARHYCEYNKVGCLYVGNLIERQLHQSACEYKQVYDLVHNASTILDSLKQLEKTKLKQDLLEDGSKWLELGALIEFKTHNDNNWEVGYVKQYNAYLKQVSIVPVGNNDKTVLVWFPVETHLIRKLTTRTVRPPSNTCSDDDDDDEDDDAENEDTDVDEYGNLVGFIDYEGDEQHNNKRKKPIVSKALLTQAAPLEAAVEPINGVSQHLLDWWNVLELLVTNNVNTCMCLVSRLCGTCCKSNCADEIGLADSSVKRRKVSAIRNNNANKKD